MLRGKRLLLAGVSVALLAALALGSVLAAPAPQTEPGANSEGTVDYRQLFVERLASLLNVSVDDLQTAAKQAAKETVDAAEENGDLAPNLADRLRVRIENGRGILGPTDHPRFGFPWPRIKTRIGIGLRMLDAQAEALGLAPAELREAMRDGKTLAELAQEKGVSAEQMKEAVVARAREQLQEAVADGNLTQKQADRIIIQLESIPAEDFLRGPCGLAGEFRFKQPSIERSIERSLDRPAA